MPAGHLRDDDVHLAGTMLKSFAGEVEKAVGLKAGERMPLAQLLDRLKTDVPVPGRLGPAGWGARVGRRAGRQAGRD